MKNFVRRFMADESGATAIEYGLIAGVIAVGIITALTTLRGNITTGFTTVGTAITGAVVAP